VNFSYYSHHPLEIFSIRQGGLSIHGMIIVGIVALWGFAKFYKLSFLKLCDVFLCASALAQSIGRWGNFFNSEAFGLPTNLPWKLYIPYSHRPLQYINFEYFHPTFLYESILDFLIFVILFLCFKKLSQKSGTIAAMYLIMYSLVRIFVEHLRIDSVLNIAGFPIAQIVSVVMLICGLAVIIFNFSRA
jgi:phosphatidylglycerol:prolipoprotein diacylglycerol transferase